MPHGFRADKSRGFRLIEQAARRIRETIMPTAPTTAALSDWRAFERLHTYRVKAGDRTLALDYAVHNLSSGVEALAIYDKKKDQIVVGLSADTYRLLERGHPRARFSFSHELGHACLHPAELIRLGSIPHYAAALLRGKKPEHPPYRDTEWQANSFAAAILMPARGLAELERTAGKLTVQLIQRTFEVSRTAAQIRLAKFTEHRGDLL